jgi:hypothetical protein
VVELNRDELADLATGKSLRLPGFNLLARNHGAGKCRAADALFPPRYPRQRPAVTSQRKPLRWWAC